MNSAHHAIRREYRSTKHYAANAESTIERLLADLATLHEQRATFQTRIRELEEHAGANGISLEDDE